FNRPEKRNAITFAMYEALDRGLREAQADAAVRAVLLAGEGAGFCAGNDLNDFLTGPSFSAEHPVMGFLHTLATFEKPLLAAVHGQTVGIGVTLLLHCDLVVAARCSPPGACCVVTRSRFGRESRRRRAFSPPSCSRRNFVPRCAPCSPRGVRAECARAAGRHMPVYSLEGLVPVVDPTAFVHPQAVLIGDVIVGARCYVGPGASLRADFGRVILGAGSNVQDCCVLHSFPSRDTLLEQDAHIGHGAVLHGWTVRRGALIGIGAIVMDVAVVEEEAFVGAASFVRAGFVVP